MRKYEALFNMKKIIITILLLVFSEVSFTQDKIDVTDTCIVFIESVI